jgi:glycosyltransferase involved in cell wall biosynthesis
VATISVVIPCWNDAPLLAEALAALERQQRRADEILVVDNGSTDATAEVAAAAGARVVYEPVRGIWPAAAAGYDAASGTVIARLDADSVPPENWLTRIESAFDSGDADAVSVDALTGPGEFYGCNRLVAFLGEKLYIGGYFRTLEGWLLHAPLFGSNFAMTRELWLCVRDDVHRTRPDIHDDLDLSLHLPLGTLVVYDRDLTVRISARPFDSWAGLSRRVAWAFRTLGLHYPADSPWRRRIDRRARRVRAQVARS